MLSAVNIAVMHWSRPIELLRVCPYSSPPITALLLTKSTYDEILLQSTVYQHESLWSIKDDWHLTLWVPRSWLHHLEWLVLELCVLQIRLHLCYFDFSYANTQLQKSWQRANDESVRQLGLSDIAKKSQFEILGRGSRKLLKCALHDNIQCKAIFVNLSVTHQ